MIDDIEIWVAEKYGPIATTCVGFPQWNSAMYAVAVRVHGGVRMGMGRTRQLAVHDLYLSLTDNPYMETALDGWWLERRKKLNSSSAGQ